MHCILLAGVGVAEINLNPLLQMGPQPDCKMAPPGGASTILHPMAKPEWSIYLVGKVRFKAVSAERGQLSR